MRTPALHVLLSASLVCTVRIKPRASYTLVTSQPLSYCEWKHHFLCTRDVSRDQVLEPAVQDSAAGFYFGYQEARLFQVSPIPEKTCCVAQQRTRLLAVMPRGPGVFYVKARLSWQILTMASFWFPSVLVIPRSDCGSDRQQPALRCWAL